MWLNDAQGRKGGREGDACMKVCTFLATLPFASLSLPWSLPPSLPQTLRATTTRADCCRRCSLTKFHRVVIARFYCARTEQNVAPRNWRYETEPRGRAGERGEWTKRSMKCASDRGGGGYLHLSPWCVNHPLFVQGSRYPHTG